MFIKDYTEEDRFLNLFVALFDSLFINIQMDCQTWLFSQLKWVLGLARVKLNIWTEAKQPHLNTQSYIYK